jgi:hypothetical protein
MTLPPRLTDHAFAPDPARAAAIVRAARRRRRTRAGAVAAATAVAVGLAALPGGGTTGLREVDPTVPRTASPAPSPDAAPSATPGSAAPDPSPSPSASPEPVEPSPGGTASAGPGATPSPGLPRPAGSVVRTAKAYDPLEGCSALATSTRDGTPANTEWCFRWSWQPEAAPGDPVTFRFEQCVLDTDVTARWADRPLVHLHGTNQLSWVGFQERGDRTETLRARTCWVYDVTWNGVAYGEGRDVRRHLTPGTYQVQIRAAYPDRSSFSTSSQDPDRQTTLVVR